MMKDGRDGRGRGEDREMGTEKWEWRSGWGDGGRREEGGRESGGSVRYDRYLPNLPTNDLAAGWSLGLGLRFPGHVLRSEHLVGRRPRWFLARRDDCIREARCVSAGANVGARGRIGG